MKKHETKPLEQALQDYLKAFKLDKKVLEQKLINNWEKIVGKMIANYTKNLYIYKETLFITMSSAVVKNELIMAKNKLIKSLNDMAGSEIIKDIVFR